MTLATLVFMAVLAFCAGALILVRPGGQGRCARLASACFRTGVICYAFAALTAILLPPLGWLLAVAGSALLVGSELADESSRG